MRTQNVTYTVYGIGVFLAESHSRLPCNTARTVLLLLIEREALSASVDLAWRPAAVGRLLSRGVDSQDVFNRCTCSRHLWFKQCRAAVVPKMHPLRVLLWLHLSGLCCTLTCGMASSLSLTTERARDVRGRLLLRCRGPRSALRIRALQCRLAIPASYVSTATPMCAPSLLWDSCTLTQRTHLLSWSSANWANLCSYDAHTQMVSWSYTRRANSLVPVEQTWATCKTMSLCCHMGKAPRLACWNFKTWVLAWAQFLHALSRYRRLVCCGSMFFPALLGGQRMKLHQIKYVCECISVTVVYAGHVS